VIEASEAQSIAADRETGKSRWVVNNTNKTFTASQLFWHVLCMMRTRILGTIKDNTRLPIQLRHEEDCLAYLMLGMESVGFTEFHDLLIQKEYGS